MISIEAFAFWIGVAGTGGYVLGYLANAKFVCPDHRRKGFPCDEELERTLARGVDVSISDFDAPAAPRTSPSVTEGGAKEQSALPGRPSCPVCKSDKTKWRPVGWNGGHWHCDRRRK